MAQVTYGKKRKEEANDDNDDADSDRATVEPSTTNRNGDDDDDDFTLLQQQEQQQQDPVYNEYQAWIRSVEKSLAGLSKKQASLQRELEKASSLEGMVQLLATYIYLFTSNKGITSVTVQDWSDDDENEQEAKQVQLTLDPTYDGSASAEANALFQQPKS
jgi:hypothetical protein